MRARLFLFLLPVVIAAGVGAALLVVQPWDDGEGGGTDPVADVAGGEAQPQTIEAARAAGELWLQRYAAGDYAGAYDLLAADSRAVMPREDYVRMQEACGTANGLGFTVTDTRLESDTEAIVMWERGPATGSNSVLYEDGRWLWQFSTDQVDRYAGGADAAIAAC